MPIGNPGQQRYNKNITHRYAKLAKQRLLAYKGMKARVTLDRELVLTSAEYARHQVDIAELQRLEYIISLLSGDEYFPVIENLMYGSLTDDALALKILCDASTVRRHKLRLLREISFSLYGTEALEYDEERRKKIIWRQMED